MLEFSVVRSLFDEIEETLNGLPMDQKQVDRITAIVLPIFYPGDNSPSRLKFSIQCLCCSYLIKLAPETRNDILISIIDIFQQYPYIFIGKTSMKNVICDFIQYVPNYWEMINNATLNLSDDVTWCFFLMCYNYIEYSKREANWNLVMRLLSNNNLLKSGKISDIYAFLKDSLNVWGPNPVISSTLTEYSLGFRLYNDISNFLYDNKKYPATLEDQTIEIIALHVSQMVPTTARALSLISRFDGKFASPLYQISLFIALLRVAPSNFRNTLAQKIKTFVERNPFHEKISAHIVAAISLCNIKGFSMIDNFSEMFSSNPQKHSLFFAYLADCADCLDISTTVPLLFDALTSIAHSGSSYGVLKFISSLLNKCRLHPDVLSHNNIADLSQYIDVIYNLTSQKCQELENQSNAIELAENQVKITAKIIAKLSLFCNAAPNFPIITNNISMTMFVCAIYAFFLSYLDSFNLPLDHIIVATITADLFGFEEYSRLLNNHIHRLLGDLVFPPATYYINDIEIIRQIFDTAQKAFRLKTCSNNLFYSTLIRYVPHIKNNDYYNKFIQCFWNDKLSNDIPLSTISKLLLSCNEYDEFFKLIVVLINRCPNDLLTNISEPLKNPRFRHWFISKALVISAFYLPNSFKIARKLILTPTEFRLFLPALKKVLPTNGTSNSVRAAAMKFIGKNMNSMPALTKYCVSLAISILLQNNSVIKFPEIDCEELTELSRNLLNNFQLAVDNRNASTLELESSLYIMIRSVECDEGLISNEDIDRIHRSLRRSNDPRIRKPYLNFLGSLGLRGIPYASQISQNVPVTPFF